MEKKKNLLLKKLAVMFAAAFLVVQLVSCGDDDPLKGGSNPNPNPNPTPTPGAIAKLTDAKEDVSGYFSVSDLNSLDSNSKLGDQVDSLNASLSVSAKGGRVDSTTRLVVVIAQDMFGNDLSGKLVDVTKPLADTNNVIAVIGGKVVDTVAGKFNTALDPAKILGAELDSDTDPQPHDSVKDYASLKAASSELFKITKGSETPTPKFTVKFGKLVYDEGKADVYAATKTKLANIIKALAATAVKMHANNKDIALVALDPFMSTLVVDLAGDASVNTANSKITTVGALAPIMKFSSAGTDAAANISYKASADMTKSTDIRSLIVDPNAAEDAFELKDGIAAKQVFNALRTTGAGDKGKSFFASLVAGAATHDLATTHSSKIANVVFHIATVETGAATTIEQTTGESLILAENASSTTAGLKAIVTPDTNVIITTLTATNMGEANFPKAEKLATLFGAKPFTDVFKK